MFKRGGRGQITLYAIIFVVLIAGIALFFIARQKGIISPPAKELEVQGYIQQCIEDSANEAIDRISIHGGLLEPEPFVMFNNINVTYLCYTDNPYARCINQHPLLEHSIENQITDYLKPRLEDCGKTLKLGLEKKGETFEIKGNPIITTTLLPSLVSINVTWKMTERKGTETTNYEAFESTFSNPIYDFVIISKTIVASEIAYHDFETIDYMKIHRSIVIQVNKVNRDKIYLMTHSASQKKFNFAVRSYIPAGF